MSTSKIEQALELLVIALGVVFIMLPLLILSRLSRLGRIGD